MTDFEFLYLLNQVEDMMWTHIMNFISVIFAMLVTSYFIAAKLTRLMSWALISLFTLGATLFYASAMTVRQDYVMLANSAGDILAADQSQVPSLNMFDAPTISVLSMDILLYVIMTFSYAATLVFFFQARRRDGVAGSIDIKA